MVYMNVLRVAKNNIMRLLTPSPFFCICVGPWHLLTWLHVRVRVREHKNDAMSVAYKRLHCQLLSKNPGGKVPSLCF